MEPERDRPDPFEKIKRDLDEMMSDFEEAVSKLSAPPPPKRKLLNLDDLEVLAQPDRDFAYIVKHPFVALAIGHRGSGKTAMVVRAQELTRHIASQFALGLPAAANKYLPDWYNLAENLSEIPPNAVIYIPESYRLFHARSSGASQGQLVGDLVNMSRHRGHTLFFDVQNPAQIDRNIVSEADLILIKEPSPLGQGFERPQLREYMDAARGVFALMNKRRRKRAIYVVAPGAGITGQIMENRLPSFWTSRLSTIFGSTHVGETIPSRLEKSPAPIRHRRRSRAAVSERRGKARAMQAAGYFLEEIAAALGVSKSQAFRYCQGTD